MWSLLKQGVCSLAQQLDRFRFQLWNLFLLDMTKPRSNCFELPLKATPKTKKQETTATGTAAQEIRVDGAFAALSLHFALKEEQRTALKAFLRWTTCFSFTPDCLWQELSTSHRSSSQACDVCLMLPLAAIRSFKLYLPALTEGRKSECYPWMWQKVSSNQYRHLWAHGYVYRIEETFHMACEVRVIIFDWIRLDSSFVLY